VSGPEYSAVVFAYHDVGVRCLAVMLSHGVNIPLVVTHQDDPKENIWFESVEQLARAYDIEVATPGDPNTPEFIERLQAISPDFIFSFYYRLMLKPAVLATAMRGAYNMHGSLLPKYRGRVPINWAVIHGERETGATLHRMEVKPDAGAIVEQAAVPILPDDTAGEVFDKVVVAAELVLDRALPGLIQGSIRERPQDLGKGSYFSGRKPEDGRIDWHASARQIHNLVRGVTRPFPGAFSELAGKRLNVWHTRVLSENGAATQPRLELAGDRLVAHCGQGGTLVLLDVDWNGLPLTLERFAAAFPDKRAPLP